MRKIIIGLFLLLSVGASAQWQQTGSKVRYVTGIGIPTKDTAAGVSADSSQILIRPADSSLYVKYKRTWLRVGGGAGGGSIGGSGTTNYIPKFTSSTIIGNSQIFDNGTRVGIGYGGASAYKFGVQFSQSSNTVDGFILTSSTLSKSYAIWAANAIGGSLWGLSNPYTGFINYTSGDATSYINDGGGYFSWHNRTAELMRLTNAGNVGIGTASPGYKLDVNGDITSAVLRQTYLGSIKSAIFSDASRYVLQTIAGYDIAFEPATVERMRITSGGNALIGTTTDNGTDKLQVSGSISGIGMKQNYVTKTGAYTATDADYVIDCTSGTFTVTLPASSGRTGRILIIKNSGAGTITVDGNASETIDGAATYSLSAQYATVQLMCDGTNWKIISKF